MEIPTIKVKALSGHSYFTEGTELELDLKVSPQATKIVDEVEVTFLPVASELKKITNSGCVIVYSSHELPVSSLALFNNGLDPLTLAPTINKTGLNQLLLAFNIELV